MADLSGRSSDYLRLSRWSVRVGIGAYESEKHRRQPLVLDVKLFGDFRPAGLSDDLAKALDYAVLKRRFEEFIRPRRWELLEAFAEQAAQFFLNESLVQAVELTVAKPRALAPALVAYCVRRSK